MPKALAAEKALRDHLKSNAAALVDRIETSKDLPKDDDAALTEAIKKFFASAAY